MIFSYNCYNKLDRPMTYLAYPNKQIFCALKASDMKTTLCFNNISEYTFTLWARRNKKKTPHYDDVTVGKYVLLHNVGWFRITDIQKEYTGGNEKKYITANSLEYETSQTYITALGSLGTSDDDDGGLDLYCLYSSVDTSHSLLHLFIDKNPSWSIGYIDPDISNTYRIFNEDRIASYDLLMSTVAEAYECLFQFDTFTKTVSAYKTENIGKITSIYLSHKNLIKQTKVLYKESDIKTLFYVTGGTDSTGTPLQIADVNPSGNNYISNFTYFQKDMSKPLQDKLLLYTNQMEENAPLYQNAISDLQIMYDELASLQNAHPDEEGSTDWTKYGSVHLKGKVDTYHSTMSIYNEDSTNSLYIDAYNNYTAASAELTRRNEQISYKEEDIKKQKKLIQSYVVNIADYLGTELYQELSVHVREDTFTDDSFIATEKMTDSDVLNMKIALYEHAKKELEKVCYPQYTMQVDAINFPAIFK